jgi:hypothetical protein
MRRLCAFCSMQEVSREHVFARWLRHALPEQLPERGQNRMRVFWPGSSHHKMLELPMRTISEPFTETRVRWVCRSCNNGWMARLEEEVKPLLTALIRGQEADLGAKDLRLIAAWATKTTMMHEFTDAGSQAYGAVEHRWLKERLEPPAGTMVWAGALRTLGDWALRAEHAGLLYRESDTTHMDDPCNTGQTTLGLGHMLVTVGYSRVDAMQRSLNFDWTRGRLIKLWPSPEATTWPPQQTIDDALAWAIGTYLVYLAS